VLSDLKCDVLVKSIGYKSLAIEGAPFDEKTNTIPHEKGCVKRQNGHLDHGLYVAGWVKRGPVGIIDATLRDASETYKTI
jgi:NADPH-dependent glutamate synthase beta subunit-like oxidoreductase